MIRKILVPVRGDGKGDNTLAHAAALAQGPASHLVVIHSRPRPQDMLPYGIYVPDVIRRQIMSQATSLADLEEEGMQAELTALAGRLGLIMGRTSDGTHPTCEWAEEEGRQADVIRRNGRLADVIVVPQPDRDRNLGVNTLKAALFQTGRPVLMVPNGVAPPAKLGRKVTIAWNGSLEASRAVTMTLPLLRETEAVTILSTGAEPNAASARDLAEYLRWHGVEATIHRFEKSRRLAADLLSLTAELGADTLIMGAYGDSHERETIFGGNTQHVVDKAAIPVILVH